MNNNYKVRYAVGQRETNQMGTQDLRDEFLIEQVFGTDTVNWIYTHYDLYGRWGYSYKGNCLFGHPGTP